MDVVQAGCPANRDRELRAEIIFVESHLLNLQTMSS